MSDPVNLDPDELDGYPVRALWLLEIEAWPKVAVRLASPHW
jgi:hypothetical protein